MTLLRGLAPLAKAVLAPHARALDAALRAPSEAQQRLRARAWEDLRETAYGGRFARYEDLPVATWEDMAPWMARQQAGEPNVVTRQRVILWEPTSGSSGGLPKRIPWTSGLRGSFSHAVAVWAHDLLAAGPPLRTGKLWFSVSPRFHALQRGGDGVPVGTSDDRDYLEGPLRLLFSPFLLTPPDLGTERDPERWRERLCTFLCARADVEVFSVWSPTLLHVLLDWMEAHRERLPRGGLVGDWARLWPRLTIVSCWDSGSAAAPAARLRERLPGVYVQGKGLLATEAPVTVPRVGLEESAVPLVDSVVLELLREDGEVMPLHRGEQGRSYELLLGQGAGLARYRLGDVVEVRGRVHDTPCLRFVGRAGAVDLVGEKLTEGAVLEAFARVGVPAGSCLFAEPMGEGSVGGYVLEVDSGRVPEGLAGRVEEALRTHHHYALARDLGQLRAVRALARPGRARRELEEGLQWGAVKGRVLRG
jgi:hypothetical protein